MGSEVKAPTFMECMGHKIYPFSERRFHDDYFVSFDNGSFVGGDSGVYQLLGQHFYRMSLTRMCVKDIFTGEVKDVSLGDFDGLTRKGGSWRMLNEMEVLAWAAK